MAGRGLGRGVFILWTRWPPKKGGVSSVTLPETVYVGLLFRHDAAIVECGTMGPAMAVEKGGSVERMGLEYIRIAVYDPPIVRIRTENSTCFKRSLKLL